MSLSLEDLLGQPGGGTLPPEIANALMARSRMGGAPADPNARALSVLNQDPQEPVPTPAARLPDPSGSGGYFERLGLAGGAPPVMANSKQTGPVGLGAVYDLIAGFVNARARNALSQRGEREKLNASMSADAKLANTRTWADLHDQRRDRVASLRSLQGKMEAEKEKAATSTNPAQAAEMGLSPGQRAPLASLVSFRESKSKAAAGGADDGSIMGEAIRKGLMQPTVLGTRMTQFNKPTFDYLAKSGYDLQKATLDYYGVQRWLSTLNGPQQTRLRQAIDAVQSQFGLIRSYNQQLRSLVPRGQIKALNNASIQLALNGAYGPQAADVAKQMGDQMHLVGTELAQVMSGGYSPLDKAISDSGKILDLGRSPSQIDATLDNLDRDVGYRRNSIYAPPISPSNPTGEAGQFNVGGRTFGFGGAAAGQYGQGERGEAPPGQFRIRTTDGREGFVGAGKLKEALNRGATVVP